MGGPNPEEEREEEEEEGARPPPPPSSAAPPDADGGAGSGDDDDDEGENDETTTPDEPQAQDGDAPPRFKGITKWFNSQKGSRSGDLIAGGASAGGREGRKAIELMVSCSCLLFLFRFQKRKGRAIFFFRSTSTSKKRWPPNPTFFLSISSSPRALAFGAADRLDSTTSQC